MALNPEYHHGWLPCGQGLDALWEQAGAPDAAEGHVASCEHCLGALEQLRALHTATRALAAEEVRTPPGLADRVMRVVCAEPPGSRGDPEAPIRSTG